MSVIRFVHTDRLRLGSPLAGLSDCPDWLRLAAGSAVRRAVSNVLEAAIASRADFVLISGSIVDSPRDFDVAMAWLCDQLASLTQHGIRTVFMDCPQADISALKRMNVIICGPDQWLTVVAERDGLNFHVRSSADASVSCSHHSRSLPELNLLRCGVPICNSRPSGLTYLLADRSDQSIGTEWNSSGIRSSRSGTLRVVAGSPQSIGPDEPGAYGCQLIEANLISSVLTCQFRPADLVRYARQTIDIPSEMTGSELIDAIIARSRSLGNAAGRTVVVDWAIRGNLLADLDRPGDLAEHQLLRTLRRALDSGNSGVWPRRIDYVTARVTSPITSASLAVQEYMRVVSSDRQIRCRLPEDGEIANTPDQPAGSPPGFTAGDALAGLEFLARAA